MTYEQWLHSVPMEIKGDTLWRMEAYWISLFASDLAWHDVSKLARDKRTISVADQLNRAVGSISATIAEGYSRFSGKDQARFFIPAERGYKLEEELITYESLSTEPLNNLPVN